jgi:hypothetical protein
MLTTRQLAMVIWLAIFVCGALTIRDVRSSAWSMLGTIFGSKLVVLFAAIIAYDVAIVWLLWRVGYWGPSMLYDTVVFVAVGGISSVSKAAKQGVTFDGRFYLATILVNLEVTVVITFLSDLFPFNFWIEFFLVIPLATLVVLLVVVSAYKKGAESVHRFLIGLQSLLGLLLIAYVVWQIVRNYGQLLHPEVLFAFGLPFVMSVLFVPALFLICCLFAYEDAFLHVSLRERDDCGLAHWKKRRLFLRFNLNLKALQTFRRSSAFHEYGWVVTKDEARACLASWS